MNVSFRDQRVGVFVDVQNMYYSAKNLYNAKVNFAQILKTAVGNRSLIRAIAYVIKADVKEEQNFFDSAATKLLLTPPGECAADIIAGLERGDFVYGLNGTAVATVDDIHRILSQHPPASPLEARILRRGRQMTLVIVSGEERKAN